VPNVLTLLRLLAVPAVVAAWPSGAPGAALWCAGLFVAASLTDWLDGYIARRVRAQNARDVHVWCL
jgi:phosphatidylglycerophosphate synthase